MFNSFLESMVSATEEHSNELKADPYLNVCEWDKVFWIAGVEKYKTMIRENYRNIEMASL